MRECLSDRNALCHYRLVQVVKVIDDDSETAFSDLKLASTYLSTIKLKLIFISTLQRRHRDKLVIVFNGVTAVKIFLSTICLKALLDNSEKEF